MLTGLIVAFMPRTVHGYWLQLPRRELLRGADYIAVVAIERTDTTRAHDAWWAYRQRATARVLNVIKGRLPPRIPIYAQEDFICSSANYQVGRSYLVFLSERDFLTTVNQAGGQFEISGDGDLRWLPIDVWHESRRMKLPDVLAESRFLIAGMSNREDRLQVSGASLTLLRPERCSSLMRLEP